MQLYLVYTHGRRWFGGKIFVLGRKGTPAGINDVLVELDDTPESLCIRINTKDLEKLTKVDIDHPACVEYITGKKKDKPIRFSDSIDAARRREDFKSFLLKQERIRFIGTLVIPAALLIVPLIILMWHYVK